MQEEQSDNVAIANLVALGWLADLQVTPGQRLMDLTEPTGGEAVLPEGEGAPTMSAPWIVGVMAAASCEIARRQIKGLARSRGAELDTAAAAADGPPELGFKGQP
jgi:hypothetical protein